MSIKATSRFAAAGAVLLLAACAQQPPPPLPVAAPLRPTARRTPPLPLPPKVQQAPQPEPVRAERVMPDRDAQRDCAYQGSLVQDHATDEDPSALGLNSALAGQSARDACLRSYGRNPRSSGGTP